jgi:exosome complex RNA-binding protein Rrp42 (RNase PH superfamily)
MCSLKYDQQHIRDNQKHEDAYGLESDLNRLLMSGEVVDLSQLCILKGKFAFRLNVNVVCLSHQGNLLDACVACVVSALRDTKLPQPVMDGERLAVSSDASTPLQLVNNTDSLLVPVSIGLFDDEWVVDLAESEETIMRATISCVLLIPADEAMGGTIDSSSNSSNSEPRILHLSQSTASGDMGAEKVSEGLRVCSSVARGLAASLV